MADQNDIYGRKASQVAGAFTADGTTVTFGNALSGVKLAVMVGLQLQYDQTVNRIFDLLDGGTWFINGRAVGGGGINRIIASPDGMKAFYARYGNVCEVVKNKAEGLTININQGQCVNGVSGGTAGTQGVQVSGLLVNRIAIGINNQDMMASENATLMFTSMTFAGASAAPPANGTVTANV